MPLAQSVGAQLAGYGPIMVATAGLITALIAGATRRDKVQEGRATSLDAKADTALRGLETALDRTEQERARWEQATMTERARADAAESRIEELEAELSRRGPEQRVRRQTGK